MLSLIIVYLHIPLHISTVSTSVTYVLIQKDRDVLRVRDEHKYGFAHRYLFGSAKLGDDPDTNTVLLSERPTVKQAVLLFVEVKSFIVGLFAPFDSRNANVGIV